jgi:hypothetical protein
MLQPLELEKPPTLKQPLEREWDRLLHELDQEAKDTGVVEAAPNARELAKLVNRISFRQYYIVQNLHTIAELCHESLVHHTHQLRQQTVFI